MSPRADVLPVAIAPFELDAEPVLLRRDEAERRVVDLEIANERRKPDQACVVCLAIGDDLLDVYGWRKCVERKTMRIDNADAAKRQEPQSAIRGFCDNRAIAEFHSEIPHSVGTIKDRRPDLLLWIGGPGVELSPCNAHQATGQIQPDRIGVILHHPVNHVARQPVPAGEGENRPSWIRFSPPTVAAQRVRFRSM